MAVSRQSAKRPRADDDDDSAPISVLTSASPVKKVEGVVVNISPMKKGKFGTTFCDGRITDGNSSMRFVAYDSKVRRRLLDCKGAITISNCEIKPGRRDGDGLEVHIRNSADVAQSSTVFDVTPPSETKDAITPISAVQQFNQYERVTVEAKVMQLHEPQEISGMKKQDLLIADTSGCIRLTIWEETIGKVTKDQSYRFTNMMVRIFKGNKFISTSKTDSDITSIDNITNVDNTEDIDFPEEIPGTSGGFAGRMIIGIEPINEYLGCIKCSGKVQEDENDEDLGQCTKCHLLQIVENCRRNVSVQMTIQGTDGVPLRLRAFTKVIYNIVQKEQPHLITPKMILKAPAFNMRHLNGVIHFISRDVTN